MNFKTIAVGAVIAMSLMIGAGFLSAKKNQLPLVAIANFGPHSSLDASIQGIKDALAKNGYIEHQNMRYEIDDVGFDASLIPQMLTKLKSHHPKVLVTLTTPVAQYAKGMIKDIPLVYSVITDPVAAGLIQSEKKSDANMTGSSDKQNLNLLLGFAKKILNNPTSIGILYSTAESNDRALLQMLKKAAHASHMQVVAVPVAEARDIPLAMQQFKHKVDLIYVGGSGAIQPTLPVIAAISRAMGIPVFNLNETAVKESMVVASFGVNYHQVGENTGKLILSILQGQSIESLPPTYPSSKDYQGFVSQKNATALGLHLPDDLSGDLSNIKVVG